MELHESTKSNQKTQLTNALRFFTFFKEYVQCSWLIVIFSSLRRYIHSVEIKQKKQILYGYLMNQLLGMRCMVRKKHKNG